jgi:hypothetical protein
VAFGLALLTPLAGGLLAESLAFATLGPGEWIGIGGLISLAVLASSPLFFGSRSRELLVTIGVWLFVEALLVFLWPAAVSSASPLIEVPTLLLLAAACLVWPAYWWWLGQKHGLPASGIVSQYVGTMLFAGALGVWMFIEIVSFGTSEGAGFVVAGDLDSPPWFYALVFGVVELWIASSHAQSTRPPQPMHSDDIIEAIRNPANRNARQDAYERSERISTRVLHIFYGLLAAGCTVSLLSLFFADGREVLMRSGMGLLICSFAVLVVGLGIAAYVARGAGQETRTHR